MLAPARSAMPRSRRRHPYLLLAAGIFALAVPLAAFVSASTSGYTLMVSAQPDRSGAVALSGSSVSGSVYVFLTPVTGITEADFWLDSPGMTGTPTHVEHSAPIDFMGTDTAGKAKPWNSSAVAFGAHSISVRIVTASATATLTTAFVVAAATPASPQPSAVSTAAPTAASTVHPTARPTSMPSPRPTGTVGPTAPPVPAPTGFVGRSGTQLTLNGQPYVFTGFNIYQANSVSNCSYTMGKGTALDTALTSIGSGSDVFRAWFFQRFATVNGQRDWSVMDHTIAVAKAHGYRIIATLGNQWGSCESRTSYYKWDSWYTGGYKTQVLPDTIVPYRQWVQEIVDHYKNEPTIAMWQIMNEAEVKIDNTSTCAPAADLYSFASDMSALIKSIDPNHLVSLGTMGGGQCGTQGSDYQNLHSISSIDVCEFHDYNHETEAMPSHLSADIAACTALNKPIFVGEAGINPAKVGGTLAARASYFKAKLAAAMQAGVSGFLVWSWNNAGSDPAGYKVGPGDPTIAVIDSY